MPKGQHAKQAPTQPIKQATREATKQAVALQYRSLAELPTVLDSTSGALADQLINIANQLGIPVHESRELVQQLNRLPANVSVPPESFRLIAEVLSFLYHLDNVWQAQHSFMEPIMLKGNE